MQNKNISVKIVLQLAYSMGKITFRGLPGYRKVTFQFLYVSFGEQFSCFNQLIHLKTTTTNFSRTSKNFKTKTKTLMNKSF